jgi:hypothetical protein
MLVRGVHWSLSDLRRFGDREERMAERKHSGDHPTMERRVPCAAPEVVDLIGIGHDGLLAGRGDRHSGHRGVDVSFPRGGVSDPVEVPSACPVSSRSRHMWHLPTPSPRGTQQEAVPRLLHVCCTPI